MKRFVSFALLLCLFLPIFARDDYARLPQVDALHYRINVTLKADDSSISAETEILFAVTSQLAIDQVPLDFAGMTVDQVSENARPAKYEQSGARLKVKLQQVYKRGDQFTLTVRYHGSPQDGLFIKENKFGDRSVFADNWPNRAHNWFPSIDHPYDKATVEFLVTAPDRYDVVANGRLEEVTSLQNGSKLWRWKEAVAIPVYCMVLGAAEFSTIAAGSWDGIPVSFYLYPKDRERGIKDYGRAVRMLEFYSKLIGPYPYEKLALVQSSTRFGGMENSSNIFFDENEFDGSGKLEDTVAHEIAHQWFGDSVTEADWHHLWLSEAFATYFGHVFFERADGRGKFLSLMRADSEKAIQFFHENPSAIFDPSIKDLFLLLNPNNYQKGGWVLHMLRHLMGDEKFFSGVRRYYQGHIGGNALTEDLQRAMETEYGRTLDWFFKEWIYQAGYPVYDAVWKWDQSTSKLRLAISQKQSGAIFAMPLDVEIASGDGVRREVIDVPKREQSFTFKLESRPRTLAIDPDEWVLKQLTLREEN